MRHMQLGCLSVAWIMLLYIVLVLFSSSLLCKAWNLFLRLWCIYFLLLCLFVVLTSHMELSLSSAFGSFLAINGIWQYTACDQTVQSTSYCKTDSPLHCFPTSCWRGYGRVVLFLCWNMYVPKLNFLFLELCTYTHQFTLLCQIQKRIAVSIRDIMKTETIYILDPPILPACSGLRRWWWHYALAIDVWHPVACYKIRRPLFRLKNW